MSADPERSKRGRNARRRGASAENEVAKYLRTEGYPDARRYLAGDGRQPGDIDWHPLVLVEVKDVAGSAWPTWCRQAIEEAREGIAAVVVRRTRGVPDVALWQARVHAPTWERATGGPFVRVCSECPIDCMCMGSAALSVDADVWSVTTFGQVVRAVRQLDA